MSGSPPPRRRLWITIGEGAAVLAVAIAALGYWDSHRQRLTEARQEAEASQARATLVLRAVPEAEGRRLTLDASQPDQVIQSQRFIFPSQVLGHAMEVTAARPRIDAAWIAPGLGKALAAAHVKGVGEARAPVAIVTAYLDGGVARQDRSLYLIGYAWRTRFLGGRTIFLQGIALQRRGVLGDLQVQVDKAWMAHPATRLLQPSGGAPA